MGYYFLIELCLSVFGADSTVEIRWLFFEPMLFEAHQWVEKDARKTNFYINDLHMLIKRDVIL
jgi:hypothetical protein